DARHRRSRWRPCALAQGQRCGCRQPRPRRPRTPVPAVTRLAGAVLLLAASLLTACSSLRSSAPSGAEDETAWVSRLAQLTTLTGWSLDGQVGFIEGKDSGSGSLNWAQQGDQSVLDFHGPLGAGAVHMEGDATSLHVKTSRGDDFTTTDP